MLPQKYAIFTLHPPSLLKIQKSCCVSQSLTKHAESRRLIYFSSSFLPFGKRPNLEISKYYSKEYFLVRGFVLQFSVTEHFIRTTFSFRGFGTHDQSTQSQGKKWLLHSPETSTESLPGTDHKSGIYHCNRNFPFSIRSFSSIYIYIYIYRVNEFAQDEKTSLSTVRCPGLYFRVKAILAPR